MSSSGLIYAVIVGAWAAYLVPMWLRRQDELNEARPTERFSTAIRLLSGRAAMERKITRQLEETQPIALPTPLPRSSQAPHVDGRLPFEGSEDSADDDLPAPSPHAAPTAHAPHGAPRSQAHPAHPGAPSPAAASRRRAAVLARRRRMVVVLFAAFTAGMVVAAVGGVALLWIPAVPAVLFSLYIAQMRRQEHRRYEVKLDSRRAAEAAQRVRQQAAARREAVTEAAAPVAPAMEARPHGAGEGPHVAAEEGRRAMPTPSGAGAPDARAGEPWADHDRPEHAGAAPSAARDDGWEPVPVPLPTYVTAPVAPRATLGLDLSASDTYSSARGRKAAAPGQAPGSDRPATPAQGAPDPAVPPRRRAPKPTTPLFDQYADETPRAANE